MIVHVRSAERRTVRRQSCSIDFALGSGLGGDGARREAVAGRGIWVCRGGEREGGREAGGGPGVPPRRSSCCRCCWRCRIVTLLHMYVHVAWSTTKPVAEPGLVRRQG